MSSDDSVYINPLASVLVCSVSLPQQDVMCKAYEMFKHMTSDEIVSLISSDSTFCANIYNIRVAIDGMDIRGVGRIVTRLIDKNYPALMKQINSNDAEFELYKSVIIGLMDCVRLEEGQ